MKKGNLVNAVMKTGVKVKKQAEKAVNAVFDSIAKSLSRGEEAAISGFGIFKVVKASARQGVNPKTGEKIHIPASKKAKFRPAKALKDAVK